VDDLRVITLPPDTEAPVPPVPRPGQAAFVQCPAAPGPDPDTAAFLRELSALTGEIERVVPDAAVSAAAAAETAVPAVVETAAKTPKRRLFGR
jgi:hypothetical protein